MPYADDQKPFSSFDGEDPMHDHDMSLEEGDSKLNSSRKRLQQKRSGAKKNTLNKSNRREKKRMKSTIND